ncbi:bifunctional [glutamate--ammonia ligase]-adenylyl-L-tyrosine phosphorylase/[glutamate--ammonia-ligase] adenylyltransferase [bacterium]|nr:bifunctional [glutamate--ammonia ligase]-adenylyl-L-tyrosine phosphorylase/[glutamate--ammonia-ligase] adenylyltransferase [bacterium]
MENAHFHPIESPQAGDSLAEFLARASAAYRWPEERRQGDMVTLADLLAHLEDEAEQLQVGAHLVRALSFAADSSMALGHLARYVLAQGDDVKRELRSLRDNPEQLHFLASLFAFSDYLSGVAIGHPEFLRRVMLTRGLNREKSLDLYRRELMEFLSDCRSAGERGCRLVLFKKRELLRIGVRDLRELAGTSELCRELSNLAEAIVESVYTETWQETVARFGLPRSEEDGEIPGFCLYAMGKFGAGELNFSSDIDLVYIYDSEGTTDGVDGPIEGVKIRRTSNHEFFNWLGREIARKIGEHTAEGFLYRVDLRLRPEGASGPLARSRAACVQYFLTQAGRWEKIAWLKARCIAGSASLAAIFEPIIHGFVFDGNSAQELFPDISRLKKRIDFERLSEEGRELDIKRGFGGIREIEFVVAGLQLVQVGQFPELKIRGTIAALALHEKLGLIDPDTAATLRRAYFLYRRIEHTLQMMHESQTHRMPAAGIERERLAIRCGYLDYRAFEEELATLRQFVRHTFQRIIEDEGGRGGLELADYLFGDSEPTEAILSELRPCRLDDHDGFMALRRLAVGTSEYGPSLRGQESFRKLLPQLLTELVSTAQPRNAVHQFDLLLRNARGFSWVYELCLSNPLILRLLLRVLGFGSLLGRLLVAHPEWLDEMLSSDGLKETRTARAIHDLGFERLDVSHETALRQLRRFKMLEGFLISVQEVLGICSAADGAARMTLLAEHVLDLSARLVLRQMGDPPVPRWAILGLGGLGDRQVHFAGDLDLAVVVEEGDGTDRATRVETIDRVFRGVIRDVGGMSPDGQLWKIDARLRPDGASGPLVATDIRFHQYYQREAGLWEWQVLTKARSVAGDRQFGDQVLQSLRCLYSTIGPPRELANEIASMKGRIEDQVRLPRTAVLDLKRSPGGVIDVEFLAQYIQLARPMEAERLFPLSTSQVLQRARENNWLHGDEAELLMDHLADLRLLQRGGRLLWETTSDYLSGEPTVTEELQRGLADQLVGRGNLLCVIEERCRRTREIVERNLGRIR